MGLTPAAILYDADGHPVAVTQDGSVYKLESFSKIRKADGSVVNPSTEETLASRASQTTMASLEGKDFATQTTLASKASEATLAAADAKLGTIDGVLDSIRDTAGVKKIVDPLPAGDNWLGKFKVGDGTNVAHTILDTESESVRRLQTEARLAPNSNVFIGAPIPPNPALLFLDQPKNGTSPDMAVDGSVTPVDFVLNAHATQDTSIYEIRIVFCSDDIVFDGSKFGPNTALVNGIKISITVNDGSTAELISVKLNEDFLRFASSAGLTSMVNNTGPKDFLVSGFTLGGLMVLKAGTADNVTITIQDDLTSVKFQYLQSTVYGVQGS